MGDVLTTITIIALVIVAVIGSSLLLLMRKIRDACSIRDSSGSIGCTLPHACDSRGMASSFLSEMHVSRHEVKESADGKDEYDLMTDTITLSEQTLSHSDVISVSNAVHEAAHAYQGRSGRNRKLLEALLMLSGARYMALACSLAICIAEASIGTNQSGSISCIMVALMLIVSSAAYAALRVGMELSANRMAVAFISHEVGDCVGKQSRRYLMMCGGTYVLDCVSSMLLTALVCMFLVVPMT